MTNIPRFFKLCKHDISDSVYQIITTLPWEETSINQPPTGRKRQREGVYVDVWLWSLDRNWKIWQMGI